LFAERGFAGTSIRDITELVGAGPAAVNYHFRNKENLYLETVQYAAEACDRASPMPSWDRGVPAPDRLRDFIRAFLGRLLSPDVPAWQRVLIMREMAQPRPGACERFVEEFVRPTFSILLGILRALLPPSFPSLQLHLVGGSIVGQCLHYHYGRHILPLLVGTEEFAGYDIDLLTGHIHAFSMAAIRGLLPTERRGGER
jgi:AcrR family transcriptional regulator